MSAPKTSRADPGSRARRTRLLLIALWLILTGLSTACVARAWAAGPHGASIVDTASHRLSNLTIDLQLPLWKGAWLLGVPSMRGVISPLILSGLGWAACIYAGVRAASWIRARRPAKQPASAAPAAEPRGLGRRAFLGRASVAAVLPATAGVAALSTPWALTTKRYRVPIRDLPPELDGLRIAQLADTHLGAWIPRSHIDRAVQIALDLKPDLYFLTGDYIHIFPDYVTPGLEALRPLVEDRRAIGTLAVRGNHDHYGNGHLTLAALHAIGARVIENDRLFLDAARRTLTDRIPDRGLCIAGLADLWQDRIDPAAALRDVPGAMPRIMLAHNPDCAEVVARDRPDSRIDLMVSGHMHGGQVWLPIIGTPWVPSSYGTKYAYGLVRGPLGPVIISAGVGMSGVPMRLMVPPEVVEITLTREA
ncbi:MAG TPA: metallophosphoesterase [Phycisphaerales bacterium]|nr:metallophosphoesterase [Phycisphaerales bacterium]